MLSYLKENVDITNLSNYKTPAKARYYFEVNSENDILKVAEIYKFAKDKKIHFLIVGGGTNILFGFDLYKGVIIKNNLLGWSYNKKSKILNSYSNESIWEIAKSLEKDQNQPLWHRFIGLPGSIGGAVFGNAGCFGLETENNFVSARVLDLENAEILTLKKESINFDYRSSVFKEKEKYFLVDFVFDLSKKVEKYSSDVDNIDFRENKQPKGNSCGSFFKNPNRENSAGSLIEGVGLKGYSIGGASFSTKHANFLISDGVNCSYIDLLELISLAQKKVKEKYGIDLINEVRIIKN